MALRRGLAPLAVAGVLTLAACSAGVSDPPMPTPTGAGASGASAPDPAGSLAPPEPSVTLPVAAAFSPAAWGLALPKTSEQKRPVVTADRVVLLDGDAVRAVDAQGRDAWTTPYPAFSDAQRVRDEHAYPLLRLVGPETVAVLDQGTVPGDGLERDRYETRVTLVSVETGAVVKAVTLPGTASAAPEPGDYGLTFRLDREGVSAVLPGGEVEHLPAGGRAGGRAYEVDGGATVGPHTVTAWEGATGDAAGLGSGFAGDRWSSTDVAPGPEYSATVEATDADHLIVGRWVLPGRGFDAPTTRVQVVDAGSGEVLSRPGCETDPTMPLLVASPDRSHLVDGPMRLTADGRADCVGGGQGQKRVDLTAVTDDGRAFGAASQGGSDTVLVDVAADGSVTTEPLADGATPPIGVMTGGVAVHWDANTAVITGNPIR